MKKFDMYAVISINNTGELMDTEAWFPYEQAARSYGELNFQGYYIVQGVYIKGGCLEYVGI